MTCLCSIIRGFHWVDPIIRGFHWADPVAGETHLQEAGVPWRVSLTCPEVDAEGRLQPQPPGMGPCMGFLHLLVGEPPGSSGIQR